MKKYKGYMDSVKASDTLHQRLTELDAPKARPAVWKRYGAVAAALVLAVGVGVWGLGRAGVPGPVAERGNSEIVPEGDIGIPDIALEGPNETLKPGQKTLGGYEVAHDGMTSYYVLPWIDYGMSDTRSELALDWDVPEGSLKRDLTQTDIAALFGGEETLSLHLDWERYTLSGWGVWNGDGTLWGLWIHGDAGENDRFELAVGNGMLPPTCIYYGDGVVSEWGGVSVTGWGCGGDRRVEFMTDGLGYRFDTTGADGELAELLVSRLVRWTVDFGLATDGVTADGAAPVHPREADPNYSVGEPNWNDSSVDTPAYDPNEAADPAYGAPSVSMAPLAGG